MSRSASILRNLWLRTVKTPVKPPFGKRVAVMSNVAPKSTVFINNKQFQTQNDYTNLELVDGLLCVDGIPTVDTTSGMQDITITIQGDVGTVTTSDGEVNVYGSVKEGVYTNKGNITAEKIEGTASTIFGDIVTEKD